MRVGGWEKRRVERIKDLLVEILYRVGFKAQLYGIRGSPSTAQGQGISPEQDSVGLDLPSSQPLRVNCSQCLRKCCLRKQVSHSGGTAFQQKMPPMAVSSIWMVPQIVR